MVTDKETDIAVGYEVIGNNADNMGELAYLFNKNYHRSHTIQDVGYENVGALCLVYGESLFREKQKINQTYNSEENQFEGGSEFLKFQATTRDDNFASKRLLEKIGCRYIEDNFKFGHNRHIFEKIYTANEAVQELDNSSDNYPMTLDLMGEEG
ncbi:hypothetical protein phytr_8080 [Candidatus Phycorickettsia trachydisci]|uniref:Uncharacterized protein n=1 Tax=Candidatus Phycorickettsia trachydisci TaxID=2115978 RepID=A0A2P1P900_9RICK|nr:hypothetical protein [Candidatus Phycorickettsia trachydisci]AVP87741.1 hypothetical protein phytr_8080 [Candidatus Phycorickettsia trachydisci]